jgi:hypothetical protein
MRRRRGLNDLKIQFMKTLCQYVSLLMVLNAAGISISPAHAQPASRIAPQTLSVMVNTNSALVNPTNFFAVNSNLMNGSVNGGSLATNALLKANNLGDVGSKRGSGANIGVYQMSPLGGNNAFTDISSIAPAFEGQIGVSYFGNKMPFLWHGTSTTSGAWNGSFAFPDIVQFGDVTHMALDSGVGGGVGAYGFIVNGNPSQGSANAWDNVMNIQNEQTNHYSALVASFSSRNNVVGWGGVFGLGNYGSTAVFSNACYIETVAGVPLRFVQDAHGFTTPVLELDTANRLKFYNNSDKAQVIWNANGTTEWSNQMTLYTNLLVDGVIHAGVGAHSGGGFPITTAAGNLDHSAFSSTNTTAIHADSANVFGGRMYSVGGKFSDSTDGQILDVAWARVIYGGVQYFDWWGGFVRMNKPVSFDAADGDPAASAQVAINSTTKGFLPPRMTKSQRNAIPSPAPGLVVYQTDNTPGLRVYNGTHWVRYSETNDD